MLLCVHASWEETNAHVGEAHFPREVCGDELCKGVAHEKDVLKFPPLSVFERCLLCRMLFPMFPSTNR